MALPEYGQIVIILLLLLLCAYHIYIYIYNISRYCVVVVLQRHLCDESRRPPRRGGDMNIMDICDHKQRNVYDYMYVFVYIYCCRGIFCYDDHVWIIFYGCKKNRFFKINRSVNCARCFLGRNPTDTLVWECQCNDFKEQNKHRFLDERV